jgi:ferritin-like protein
VVSETIETPVVNVTAASDGVSVTLTAAASVTDAGTITYQWYKNTVDNSKNGAIIAGATRSIYIPTVSNDGTTYYYVKVTNNLKGQTADAVSNTVKIIVQSGGITEWIVSDSVKTPTVNIAASVIGTSVTITATASATDNGTLSYQWYRNIEENSRTGSPIAGAVGTTYMPSTASPGTTYYYVKVTNTLKGQTSTATSNVLGVTVHESGGSVDIIEVVDTPTVSIESSVNGRTVTITATASVNDGGRLSYQWYSNEHNNRNGEEITGATERIYAPPTDAFGTTYYYVRVTNTLNGKTAVATSNIVGVAVPEGGGNIEVIEIETPDIDTPKVNIEANVNGRTVTITATASVTDGGELSYQWYSNSKNNKEGTRIAGATETSYIPTTEAVSTVYYYVEVTNSLNGNVASATSNIVGVVVPEDGGSVVIVEAEIPVATVIASPAPGPYAVGAVVVLTASASTPSDGGIISYQWYSNAANNKNGTIINGAIGSSYTAVTTSLATTYYYVMATNTLKGQTASATSNIVEITVVPTQITQATVGVIHPVKSAEPNAQVTTTPLNYTNGPVIWSSGGTVVTGFFEGNTAYTATVTLTANAGYTFAANFTATINTFSAIVTDKSETSVTISHAFGKTLGKDVKSVAVTTQPTKLSYTHGDELDLAGLEIKITYDDDSYDQGEFLDLVAELGQDNVSASPAHGQKLMVSHGGGTVTISAGGKNTPTQTLAVAKKGLTITAVSHTKIYDGTTAVNQNALSVSTWTGVQFNEAVTGINGIQAVYTSADAGTDTVNITDGVGTIVGQAASNYYVAGVSNVMVTDGIIKADPVVTWPTGLTASYGTGANTLAGVSLTGNNGSATGINSTSITGTFTWNTPARNIGDAGPRSHRMIFTPDSMNYNTITDTVSITVIEKPVTLTVGAVSRTLSAIDDATFSVTVDGLVSGHTVTFGLASNAYGLSVSSGTITTGESVTMTYNGTTTVTQTTALSVGLTMTDSNNYYTLSGSPTVAPTVVDGRDAARPIPVTQENITRFNEYANTSNGLTRHYKVTENITIADVVGAGNWTPISSFTGSFDGQGYTITNLYVYIFDSTTRRVLGMFSYVNSGAIIKNIGLIKLNISGCYNDSSGGVVGSNAGTVENCYVGGINTNNSFVSSTNINTSSNTTFYVGGVVGTNSGTVKNCYAIADVRATDNNSNVKVGGVVGVNSGTVQNCAFFNNGDGNKAVRSNGSNSLIGGVVGYMTGGTVQNCFASGNISNESNTSTNSNVGGVVGYMTGGTVQNCYAAGSVRGGEGLAGGVVGNIGTGTTTVTKCVALNSSITTRNSASTSIGRVWGGTTAPTTSSYNHGRNITGNPTPAMTMTYNNGTAYTLTSSLTGRDGANTTTYRTQTFWTGSAAANWGGTTWDISTATTNIWQWYGTDGTTGRPILQNMPSGFYTNNYN